MGSDNNQHPLRNYQKLQTWCRCDDQWEKQLFFSKQQWWILKRLAEMVLAPVISELVSLFRWFPIQPVINSDRHMIRPITIAVYFWKCLLASKQFVDAPPDFVPQTIWHIRLVYGHMSYSSSAALVSEDVSVDSSRWCVNSGTLLSKCMCHYNHLPNQQDRNLWGCRDWFFFALTEYNLFISSSSAPFYSVIFVNLEFSIGNGRFSLLQLCQT